MFGRKRTEEEEDLALQPPPGHAPDGMRYGEAFRHNRFLLAPEREKSTWQCGVADLEGAGVLEARQERPFKWRALPWIGTATAGVLGLLAIYGIVLWLWEGNPWRALFAGLVVLVAGIYAAVLVRRLLTVDREIIVDSQAEHQTLMRLVPERLFGWRGQIFHVEWERPPVKRLGSIRREGFAGGLRARYIIEGPPDQKHTAILLATEVPLWRALLRRLLLGRRSHWLKTDVKLVSPGGGMAWGRLHRRDMLHGCHVLDLTRDWEGSLDRRTVLALAILLDIGGKHPGGERD